jgi:DNA-binding MarR family transcriptional regulator
MPSKLKRPPSNSAETELAGDLCWLLSRASHSLTTEMSAALESVGLSPRQHQVLTAAQTGPHTQVELARTVGLDKTTMVVTIDELEANGLAERRPSESDRRARIIAVTDAGRKKIRAADEILARIRGDVLATLPAEERVPFIAALTRLVSDRFSQPAQTSRPARRPPVRA